METTIIESNKQFGNYEITPIQKRNNYQRERLKPTLRCELHVVCVHTTSECRLIRSMKHKLATKNFSKKVNLIVHDDITEETSNKEDTFYSIRSVFKKHYFLNPFLLTSDLVNINSKVLIDTGADINIINVKALPKSIQIHKTNIKANSTSGTQLNIIGEIKNFPLRIDDINVVLDAAVVEGAPEYCIVGAATIMKQPELLTSIMESGELKTSDYKVSSLQTDVIHSKTTIESLINQFSSLFQTEISDMTLCNVTQHSIITNQSRPIHQSNFAIPVHYEKDIDEEIKKNLKLGIIKESNSEWCSRIVPVEKKDGKLRLCIDFRSLNDLTTKDRYPIPRIDFILDKLSKAKFFSTLDAMSG